MPTGKLPFRWCADPAFRQCPYCETVAHIDWWEEQLVKQWRRVQELKMKARDIPDAHPYRELVAGFMRARLRTPSLPGAEFSGWAPRHRRAAAAGGGV